MGGLELVLKPPKAAHLAYELQPPRLSLRYYDGIVLLRGISLALTSTEDIWWLRRLDVLVEVGHFCAWHADEFRARLSGQGQC